MTFDPWFPYVIGFIVIAAGCFPALFIPETVTNATFKSKARQPGASSEAREGTEPPDKQPMLQEIVRQAREFSESTRFIWRDSNVCLLIFVAGVGFMSRQSTNLLMQYASKKFNWTIGQVRYSPLDDSISMM